MLTAKSSVWICRSRMFTRKSGVQKERCVFIYLILTKCKWTAAHWHGSPVGYVTGFRRVIVTFSERLHNVILFLLPAVIVTLLWERYAVSIVFVLTLISRLSFLTNTPRCPFYSCPSYRVVPCLSLLPVYKTDLFLLDGHIVRVQRCPSQRERERERVNYTMEVFSFCNFMTEPSLSAIHRIILAACRKPVMNIYILILKIVLRVNQWGSSTGWEVRIRRKRLLSSCFLIMLNYLGVWVSYCVGISCRILQRLLPIAQNSCGYFARSPTREHAGRLAI